MGNTVFFEMVEINFETKMKKTCDWEFRRLDFTVAEP